LLSSDFLNSDHCYVTTATSTHAAIEELYFYMVHAMTVVTQRRGKHTPTIIRRTVTYMWSVPKLALQFVCGIFDGVSMEGGQSSMLRFVNRKCLIKNRREIAIVECCYLRRLVKAYLELVWKSAIVLFVIKTSKVKSCPCA
jgi:hypothetical protein